MIGVTANGNKEFKSFYSSYGVGTADVIAPGGDRPPGDRSRGDGRVLSTWPATLLSATCAVPRRRRPTARLLLPSRAPRWPRRTSRASQPWS